MLFIFCEIDCREGILLAVEKDRYDDLEHGIRVVVDIYIAVLLKLVRRKKLRALVHPVVPVLDVTRHIVAPFNKQLEKRVREEARSARPLPQGQRPDAQPSRLHSCCAAFAPPLMLPLAVSANLTTPRLPRDVAEPSLLGSAFA